MFGGGLAQKSSSVISRKTLVIVPPNDEEAYVIADLADRLGFLVHRSAQRHGARLESEPGIFERVKKSGADTVVIVEMPGPDLEKDIQALGKHLILIDHHNYTDLDRAHDVSGAPLPSSLEQFLHLFDVDDETLRSFGYHPRFVRGVGLWDAGYLWALLDAGYTKGEIEAFLKFKDELAARVDSPEVLPRHQEAAAKAWAAREPFANMLVVISEDPGAHIRSGVSRLAATTFWKPTPMMISERAGRRLYVQETDRALDLFHRFGGFTFGTDRNWGYDNEVEKEKITLADLKAFFYDAGKTVDARV
jgi:hypothetical protein